MCTHLHPMHHLLPRRIPPAHPWQCQYFKNVHSFAGSGYQYRLHDIEDLKGFGKSHKACPYFTARKWADVSGGRTGPWVKMHRLRWLPRAVQQNVEAFCLGFVLVRSEARLPSRRSLCLGNPPLLFFLPAGGGGHLCALLISD